MAKPLLPYSEKNHIAVLMALSLMGCNNLKPKTVLNSFIDDVNTKTGEVIKVKVVY